MDIPKLDFLWQYVEHWDKVDPACIALSFNARKITYGQFEAYTDNLAKSFLKLGLQKGDTIVTMLPTSIEYIVALIAADKAGAIVTAMDVRYKAADLRRYIAHIQPKIMITLGKAEDASIAATLESVCRDLGVIDSIQFVSTGEGGLGYRFDELTAKVAGLGSELKKAKAEQHLDDGLLIVFTGGTTGVPKAALLSKQNVTAMAAIEAEYMNRYIPPRSKAIASLPPSHVGGTVEIIGSAICGGYEIIVHESWSPTRVLQTTQAEKLPYMGGVPTMFAIMLLMPDLEKYDLSSIKLAIMSGEKVELDLLNLIKTKICPNIVIGYGSTEGGSEVTLTEVGDSLEELANGYVGKVLPGMEIKIVDENDRALPPGEIGEVLVRGSFTIKGYFKMPEEDRVGFTADGFCRTGDLGYMTPDNGLYIKGRKKHIIRVGGYTVMPAEVEEVVVQVPGVGVCAVIGVPDKVLGEVVWAVVQPIPGQTVTEEQIIAKCKQELASFKVPRKVLFKSDMPLTRIGKVHRVELQKEVIASLQA